MKIAIMSCRKLMGMCSGSGCFEAYNNLDDAFDIYKEKPELASFFYCIGCEDTLVEGEDWEHKMKQLQNKNVENIHLALCTKIECDNYKKHENILRNYGFNIVHGSHKSKK